MVNFSLASDYKSLYDLLDAQNRVAFITFFKTYSPDDKNAHIMLKLLLPTINLEKVEKEILYELAFHRNLEEVKLLVSSGMKPNIYYDIYYPPKDSNSKYRFYSITLIDLAIEAAEKAQPLDRCSDAFQKVKFLLDNVGEDYDLNFQKKQIKITNPLLKQLLNDFQKKLR